MRFNKVKAKTALLTLGKTQTQIAAELKFSRRWVGAALNGEKSISEKSARRIAATLGVTVEELKED